jgi:SAM-dependent methyltransferase
MTLYAATIFLSAFLLFQVQPLIAKIILPWFGGSAAVWSAALLFFQVSLLAGYAYAHGLAKVAAPRAQRILHLALIAASCAILPILPSPDWKPTAAGDPTGRILVLLGATIGLPYFLLSSTSPLLQAWFVRSTGSQFPWRLFALSNLGSMLGLLTFPFLVEPRLTSRQQAFGWSGAYGLFALLCAWVAWASLKSRPESPAAVPGPAAQPAAQDRPGLATMFLWVALAACASALLVTSTNHLSQNVAPIPLLWVLPLALYLLTFILCFESDRYYQRWIVMPWLAPALSWMAYSIYAQDGNLHIKYLIPIYLAGLFICCMLCHGELATRKPSPRHLTLYYLLISLGGALGGGFVAVVGPRVFRSYLELPIALVGCAALAATVLWDTHVPRLGPWPARIGAMAAVGLLAGYLGNKEYSERKGYRVVARNFYGVLHVRDDNAGEEFAERNLLHGTINHGNQLLAESQRHITTSYYAENSGVGRALRALQERGPVRYADIGLGAGVLANYGRQGDYLRIYEINPLVQSISLSEFTFFNQSAAADKRILLGDARLTLEAQEPQNFDLIAVDAFSSDAIPIHLLTREAIQLYFRHLKPEGVLALHISNRYLDLQPVCAAGAEFVKRPAMVVSDEGEGLSYLNSSTWVLVTSDPNLLSAPSFQGANTWQAMTPPGFRPWTDDYSNVACVVSDVPGRIKRPVCGF